MVPSQFVMSFLFGGRYSHTALDQLMGRLRATIEKDNDPKSRGLLLQICHSSLSRNYTSGKERDLYLGPVAVHAAFLGDASLFTKVVEQIEESFEKDYYCALGELICLQDLVVQEKE